MNGSKNCVRCSQPITATDKTEKYKYPDDGRRVHSKCLGEMIGEVLELMKNVPNSIRLLDPEDDCDA